MFVELALLIPIIMEVIVSAILAFMEIEISAVNVTLLVDFVLVLKLISVPLVLTSASKL